jgi:signal transduction histidine kinase
MKKLKNLFFFFFSLFALLWTISLYFSFNPERFPSPFVGELNFLSAFFLGLSTLFLIFSLSETTFERVKKFLFFFVFSFFLFFLFFYNKISFSTYFILIFSFFLIFLLWILSIIAGYFFKILFELKVTYTLILFGFFLILNAFVYFFLSAYFPSKDYLLILPISSLVLILIEGLIISISFFESKILISGILMALILGILFFLSASITEIFLRILTGVALLLFFVLNLYFIQILFEESRRRKEFERIIKEEKELAEAKDQFILSIQHHLRTPLTPIKGYLERILDGTYGREENPIIKEKLIEMKKLVDNFYSLVEKLLDIQEFKLKKEKLILEDCQIEDLIESVVEELLPFAKEKNLYLKYKKTKLPTIKIDKRRIREAIWNIVDNAIRYTTRGGVEILTEVQDRKIKIAISDTGIGMEKEEIERFLEGKIFERGKEAKKLYGPGRGIGLALAIEFIKAHGGKISAISEGFGKGTTFFIELPIK